MKARLKAKGLRQFGEGAYLAIWQYETRSAASEHARKARRKDPNQDAKNLAARRRRAAAKASPV